MSDQSSSSSALPKKEQELGNEAPVADVNAGNAPRQNALRLHSEHFEVRLNDDHSIDEIIARGVKNVHLEQMDAGCWWMGITDLNDNRLMVNLFNKRNAKIIVNAESEDGKISAGFER